MFPEGTTGKVTLKSGSFELETREIITGQASFTTSRLRLGKHKITAVYEGPSGQVSVSITQTINQADPTVVLNCSPNWSNYSEPLECEATLPVDATGIITFLDGDIPIAKSEAVKGSAIYTIPRLSTGSHLLTAAYSGDSNYRPAHGRQMQTILQTDSWVKLSCAPNPAWFGEFVTCSATTPFDATGSIIFTEGGYTFARVKLIDGNASFTTPRLVIGYHYLSATYGGDTNYRSSSAGIAENVLDPYETLQ